MSHKRLYASIIVLTLLVFSSIAYAYISWFAPSATASSCPAPPAATDGNAYACIYTSKGYFEVELFTQSAPKTVANFINLAESGFYDNLVWHRISTSNPSDVQVIQTGDPLTRNGGGDRSDWGTGGSNQTVPLEVSNSSLHNYRGYLGMARGASNNSGTSQFYINTQNNLGLDGRYTVFGRVVSGMGVVDALAAVQTYGPDGQYPEEQPVDPSQAMLLKIVILTSS
jgi:cyclophilin family peptidyl-prolyl cis-trans isomerase